MTAKTSRGGAAATNFQLCLRGARWRGSAGDLGMTGIVRIGRRAPALNEQMFEQAGSGQERAPAQGDPLGGTGEGAEAGPERGVLTAEMAEHLAVPATFE